MAIHRDKFQFPEMKQGDTYQAPTFPVEGGPYNAGGTVLGQIRDPSGALFYNWPGTLAAGVITMADIQPEDTFLFPAAVLPADQYIAEIQITEPSGRVTTEVNAGRMAVIGDNCYVGETPLITPGSGTTPGTSGMRLKREPFNFLGAGPYETAFPPDGQYAEVELDGLGQADDPFEIVPTGFLLVGVSDVQKVVFRYSY